LIYKQQNEQRKKDVIAVLCVVIILGFLVVKFAKVLFSSFVDGCYMS